MQSNGTSMNQIGEVNQKSTILLLSKSTPRSKRLATALWIYSSTWNGLLLGVSSGESHKKSSFVRSFYSFRNSFGGACCPLMVRSFSNILLEEHTLEEHHQEYHLERILPPKSLHLKSFIRRESTSLSTASLDSSGGVLWRGYFNPRGYIWREYVHTLEVPLGGAL